MSQLLVAAQESEQLPFLKGIAIHCPPFELGVRWMAGKNFSLAGYAGFSRSWSSDRQVCGNIRGSWFNRTYFIGIENGAHYTKAPNWDVYGGLSLLYQYVEVHSDLAAKRGIGEPPPDEEEAYAAWLVTKPPDTPPE